ncbi:Hypothetical protein PHPALM_37611 [Phytophthora palmivora]|uniref:Uncharacterized protein n=1 Tax=Phytophthora palmivora TaxID=4796 RepID=A0A2P4WWZ7_9STRA|nr:Hypothetical protein PHPALM_37611 [Phytophthora palmivora]
MVPIINGGVEDQFTSAHVALLTSILKFLSGLLLMPCIRSLTTVLQTDGHRLNLAVNAFMIDWKLGWIKFMHLCASCVVLMLRRYSGNRFFKFKEAVETEADAIAELIPTKSEENRLQLSSNSSRTLKLRLGISKAKTVCHCWTLETCSTRSPNARKSLGAKVKIMKSPVFESACVDVLMEKADLLSRQLRPTLSVFAVDADAETDQEGKKYVFADWVLKKR